MSLICPICKGRAKVFSSPNGKHLNTLACCPDIYNQYYRYSAVLINTNNTISYVKIIFSDDLYVDIDYFFKNKVAIYKLERGKKYECPVFLFRGKRIKDFAIEDFNPNLSNISNLHEKIKTYVLFS